MPIQFQMDDRDRLALHVSAAIEKAIPTLPFAGDQRNVTGVIVERHRGHVTAFFNDFRDHRGLGEKAAFQRRFQDRSFEALVREFGAARVQRVSKMDGHKGVRVNMPKGKELL